MHRIVSCAGMGCSTIVREKLDCLGYSFALCCGDIAFVASVVVGGGSKVPGVSPSTVPRFSRVRGLINKSFTTRGGEWGAVVVECAVDVMVRRDFWV